jgi:hypothetical protein
MSRIARLATLVWIAVAVLTLGTPAAPAQAQNRLCFAEVPDCIEGRFAEYWQQNGGLPVFGFPISPARLENVGGGQFLVQTFERNRFELHPENARPYDVLLGRLGDDRLRQLGRPWENEPKATSTNEPGCAYFAETQHLVCNAFLNYWRSNGLNLDGRAGFTTAESLALFGLPLTEARMEQGSDGNMYLTQWFERARFELHPQIGPNAVLLGLLGRETSAPPPSQPTPPPSQPAPPPSNEITVPPSQNARVQPDRGPAGTVFSAQGLGFQPGENIGVYITAPDQSVIGAPFQVTADGSGVSEVVTLTTRPGFPEGLYAITFEGVSSRRVGIAYFAVTPRPSAPPSSDTSVPPSVNAVVQPPVGPIGTVFAAQGRGFQPGENIGVYATAPDQTVYGAPFQVVADANGLSEVVFFQSGRGDPPGVYALTFEGVRSGHRAIAYFRILP